MKVNFDEKKELFNVFVSKDEVRKAFESKENYLAFLKQIVNKTYGEEMTKILFPDPEEGDDIK